MKTEPAAASSSSSTSASVICLDWPGPWCLVRLDSMGIEMGVGGVADGSLTQSPAIEVRNG